MFYFSIRSEPSQSAEGGRTVVSQASFLAVVEYSYFDRVADVPCIEPTVQVSRTTLTTNLLYHHRHSYFLLFSDLIRHLFHTANKRSFHVLPSWLGAPWSLVTASSFCIYLTKWSWRINLGTLFCSPSMSTVHHTFPSQRLWTFVSYSSRNLRRCRCRRLLR